jgi:hypothetical protein
VTGIELDEIVIEWPLDMADVSVAFGLSRTSGVATPRSK